MTTCARACATRWRARASAFRFGILPTRIEKRGDGTLASTLSDGETIDVDQVLVATGRLPNTNGLGLENAGVEVSAVHGAVKVDEHLTSNVPSIHAVGDVTHRDQSDPGRDPRGAHARRPAVRQGRAADPLRHDRQHAVFGTPELGAVGLTEAEASRAFPEASDVYKTDFRPMKATVSGSPERTIMKLVVDGATERILGAHILAHEAAEMIQLVAVAMTMGATKADFDATVAVHPTAAEELVTMRAPTARYEDGMEIP